MHYGDVVMKESNRKVSICDVERKDNTSEDEVKGESVLAGQLAMPSLPETKIRLSEDGWKNVEQCKIYNGRLVDIWQRESDPRRIAVWEMVRWIIWVDLEGFSHVYMENEDKALWALRGLVRDLHSVGVKLYPYEPERLFIHQVGDGFVVEPDFGDIDLLRPIALGIALHRASVIRGSCLKIAIGLGTLADVQGCYPDEIMSKQKDGAIQLGTGLMTVFPVMGDGLIDAHEVSKRASGPLLLVRGDLADALPNRNIPTIPYHRHFEVDWMHADLIEATDILTLLGHCTTPINLEEKLTEYLGSHDSMGNEWRKSAKLLIRGY